jgi:hypothetical protein
MPGHTYTFTFIHIDGLFNDTASIVAYVQPLLCNRRINNDVMQPVSRERLGKHIPTATNTHATIENPVSKQRFGKHTTIRVKGKVVPVLNRWSTQPLTEMSTRNLP